MLNVMLLGNIQVSGGVIQYTFSYNLSLQSIEIPFSQQLKKIFSTDIHYSYFLKAGSDSAPE